MNSRHRPMFLAAGAILLVWLFAWGAFTLSRNSRMTPEKLKAFVEETDLSRLSEADRAKALRQLADRLNALSPDDRRRARMDGLARRWFEQMTEQEKSDFIEMTMPTGFRQMITSFEKLPEERRKKVIDDAVKRMREARENGGTASPFERRRGTNSPPLSEELEKKVMTIGLGAYYTQSSAQTKAELAPLMEEIQNAMETGRMFRRSR